MPDLMPPNFVNPDYASPEQIAQQRAYAKALQDAAVSGGAKTGIGAIASALMGFQGQRGMGQANAVEQASKQAQTKMLMEGMQDWQTTGNPAKLLGAISGPQANPLQAVIMRQLLEYGPQKSITTEGITGPTPPIGLGGGRGISGGGVTGITPTSVRTTTEPVGRPMPATPQAPVPAVNIPGGGNLSDQNITGVQYGPVTGAPPGIDPDLAKAIPTMKFLQTQKAETAAQQTEAQKRAEQRVKTDVTSEITGDIKKNLQSDIPDALNFIDKYPTKTTGRVAWMTANVPGTEAHAAAEKLKKIESAVLQHEIQTIEDVEQRRVSPDEAYSIRKRLGLDQQQDYKSLRYNLEQLQKRFGGGKTHSRQGPTNLTPQPGQAQAEPGRETAGFKILKVRPPLGQ